MKRLMINCVLMMVMVMIPAHAQNATDIESASMAVEQLLDQEGSESIATFIDQYMIEVEDRVAMIKKIGKIRRELSGIRDGIGLDVDGSGAILTFSSQKAEKRLRIHYDNAQQKVTDLSILQPEEKLTLDTENLSALVQEMKEQDMAGLIHIKKEGEILLEEAFGMANDTLGVPNSTETIFAVGSRPIDFTVAAIYLLDQQGVLNLDDPIGKFLENVPEDKQGMTLRHLMTGASGLPDFFDNDTDWDADLQWVDREEAITRMMNQTLLFEPGSGKSHSHGAFGLLAAVIELKTGNSYMEFLHQNFFDPAGMTRTGEYGDRKDFKMEDFAVGGGPQFVGIPNIPPNWGPTSWLIKGSGGMYSTLGDLQKFYTHIREGKVLDKEHARHFRGATVQLDGSMRGFELFSVYIPQKYDIYLFLNKTGDPNYRRKVFRALEALAEGR